MLSSTFGCSAVLCCGCDVFGLLFYILYVSCVCPKKFHVSLNTPHAELLYVTVVIGLCAVTEFYRYCLFWPHASRCFMQLCLIAGHWRVDANSSQLLTHDLCLDVLDNSRHLQRQ